jgi:hypothetical protein
MLRIFMSISQIYRDDSLYGHTLTSLPNKIWAFSQGKFSLYRHSVPPGNLIIEPDWTVFRRVNYTSNTHCYIGLEFVFEEPFLNLIEFIGRRILGPCAAVLSYLTLLPIGFTAKIIHLAARQISNCVASTTFVQQIRQIWNNADLFGHALTSAPSQFYAFAISPLIWHLREDGTDRRSYIGTFGPDGHTIHQSEYALFPFELFEFIYKRAIGGTLMVASSMISPIGLIAKGIHQLARSVLT